MNNQRILVFQKFIRKIIFCCLIVLLGCVVSTGESRITHWSVWFLKASVIISALTSIYTIIYLFIKAVKDDIKNINK